MKLLTSVHSRVSRGGEETNIKSIITGCCHFKNPTTHIKFNISTRERGWQAAGGVKRGDVGALCGLPLRRGTELTSSCIILRLPNPRVGCANMRSRQHCDPLEITNALAIRFVHRALQSESVGLLSRGHRAGAFPTAATLHSSRPT